MGHPAKKSRDTEGPGGDLKSDLTSAPSAALLEAGESDDEYEDIPARHPKGLAQGTPMQVDAAPAPVADGETPAPAPRDETPREVPQVSTDATDDDWLRSRTSRLLDLVDPDDPAFSARPPASVPTPAPAAASASGPQEPARGGRGAEVDGPGEGVAVHAENPKDAVKLVEKTSRLFLRNLGYNVTEDDVRDHFSQFGSLEEVRISCFFPFLF
jgi:multiple RNA-binding domain-containing protein 1